MLMMFKELLSVPLFLALLLGLFFIIILGNRADFLAIPTVSYAWFLPKFLNRALYYPYGKKFIYEGYKKYNRMPFRVLKSDGDLIVLPEKYIEELRNVPSSVLSSLDAQANNIISKYTTVLTESHLPSVTVMKRLNPAIARIMPTVMQELNICFKTDVPKCEDEWVPVKVFEMLLNILSRSTSRIIAGNALSRNEQWLKLMAEYTQNIGITLMLLRPLPECIRPFVAWMLPSVRNLKKQMEFAKNELFVPMIIGRRHMERYDPRYEKPDDFLQWMMDLADNPRDADPEFMAHNLFVVMSLAFVHTSAMLMTYMIYDLAAMPEYLEPLREEAQKTFKDGWANATQASFLSQHRMDSFMKEVQRFNPPAEETTHIVSMYRVVRKSITLSDGFVLPKGVQICFAAGPLTLDSEVIPEALPLDGLRWARNPECKSNSFVSMGPANMHFGYGRQACPGRFFAASSIKAVMSRLIIEYDFKFKDGRTRPANLLNGEQIMPNMFVPIFMRKRKGMTI